MCLCSLLLCCAGTAIGQSVSGNASDVAGASVDASPESASASSVDAIADSAVAAATRGGSAYRSESGLGSSHANMALARGKTEINANRLSRLGAHPASSSGDLSRRARASTPNKRGALAASANGVPAPGGAKGPGTGIQGAGTGMESAKTVAGSSGTEDENAFSYSRDFPDSTKGTALLSPPDPGTESPLDWNPELGFSFPDFAQREFLMPSLHVGEHLEHTRQSERDRLRRAGAKSVSQSPASSLQNENNTIDTNILEPGILGQSTLSSNGLGQSPSNPSTDRY